MKVHSNFSDKDASGQVFCYQRGYLIQGQVKSGKGNLKVEYWAPNPPDERLSIPGTALPFANEEMAYEPSVNVGSTVTDGNGKFEFSVAPPNSYYSCQGRHLVPPHVNFTIEFAPKAKKQYYIRFDGGYRNRSLTNLPGRPDRSYDR